MNKIRTETKYITSDRKTFGNLKMAEAWQRYVDIEEAAMQKYEQEFLQINNELHEQYLSEIK